LSLAVLAATGFATQAMAQQFDKMYCIAYSILANYPKDALLFGVDRGQTVDVPFTLCLAKSGDKVIAMDSGYVNQEVGAKWGGVDYVDYKTSFAEVGIKPEDVNLVTIGHMHWDHGGGTSAFPNAKFVVEKTELEFAAGAMTQNKQAKAGFEPEDVLAMVKLNWEGRVILADGDVKDVAPDVVPGVDVYLTPGHTAGTMSTCIDTTKGQVCYVGDAVYMYRNIEEDIPLGFGLNLYQMLESYKKIREFLGDGILVPGHEPELFADPEKHGFKKISDRIIAVVE
jgi:glyoxylase-like metal-dependent hydrolase (beta-lactamase superfamily II)